MDQAREFRGREVLADLTLFQEGYCLGLSGSTGSSVGGRRLVPGSAWRSPVRPESERGSHRAAEASRRIAVSSAVRLELVVRDSRDRRPEPVRQLPGRLRTQVRVFFQAAHHHLLDLRRHVDIRVGFLHRQRLLVEVGHQHLHVVSPREGQRFGQQLIEQHAHGIEVAPAVDLPATTLGDAPPDLFGAHVVGSAHDVALAGQLGTSLVLDHLGNTKVEHLEILPFGQALDQDQVRGLQVAMDDGLDLAGLLVDMPMSLVEDGTELIQQLGRPLQGNWRLFLSLRYFSRLRPGTNSISM